MAKPAEKSKSSDACRLCGINFKISVGDLGGKNKYISTENLFRIPQRAGVDKIRLADLLKIHLGVEVVPKDLMENLPVFARSGRLRLAMQVPCSNSSGHCSELRKHRRGKQRRAAFETKTSWKNRQNILSFE